MLRFFAALAFGLLSGCALKQAARHDPLADLYTAAAPAPSKYRNLTVAVISSANTKEVGNNIGRSKTWTVSGGGGNYKDIFTAIVDVLKRQFKEVSVAENSKNFAIVIGVEKYENLPPAEFAERDAASVRAHLLALGYPERNIVFLTGSKATRTGIEKYLESWLPRNVAENSQVFVYFSGHGAPDVNNGKAYIMPWDGDSKFVENTGYPIKRLYEKLNALKARRVIVALDSCFSGAGGRSVLAKGARPLVTKTNLGNDEVRRLVVFAASGSDEITATDESQGHGLFTYQFLAALNEKKGEATVRGLYDVLLPRVQDAARRDNRDQTPQLLPLELGDREDLKLH